MKRFRIGKTIFIVFLTLFFLPDVVIAEEIDFQKIVLDVLAAQGITVKKTLNIEEANDVRAIIAQPEKATLPIRFITRIATLLKSNANIQPSVSSPISASSQIAYPVDLPKEIQSVVTTLVNEIEKLRLAQSYSDRLYGSARILEVLQNKIEPLVTLSQKSGVQTQTIKSSIGDILIAGSGNDDHRDSSPAIIIDLGGKDKYTGDFAASSSLNQISVVIDLDGDDWYENTTNRGAQGSAIGGVAILYDLSGNDIYKSVSESQGYGTRDGIGILWDSNGDDKYYAFKLSQGFGGEYLPRYKNMQVGSQSGVNPARFDGSGSGLLIDVSGNDVYYSQNLPGSTSEQQPGVGFNSSQGVGVGQQGFGYLIDLGGNDLYVANLSAQGCGWDKGEGGLFDIDGNDTYVGIQYVQGAASHEGIGLFYDGAGADIHIVNSSQGLGSAKNAALDKGKVVAIFIDDGNGNDVYKFHGDSAGVGLNDNAEGYFFDIGGEDVYSESSMGDARLADGVTAIQNFSLGFFYDHSGSDTYPGGNVGNGVIYLKSNHRNLATTPVIPDGTLVGLFVDQQNATGSIETTE